MFIFINKKKYEYKNSIKTSKPIYNNWITTKSFVKNQTKKECLICMNSWKDWNSQKIFIKWKSCKFVICFPSSLFSIFFVFFEAKEKKWISFHSNEINWISVAIIICNKIEIAFDSTNIGAIYKSLAWEVREREIASLDIFAPIFGLFSIENAAFLCSGFSALSYSK